jgi:hypothetical protein
MFRTTFVVAALSVGLSVVSARAGTPFGGDDGGFIPPDVGNAKCEAAAAKLVVKTVQAILKAHNKRAKGHIDPGTEEGPEATNFIGRIAPVLGRLFRSGVSCNAALGCLEDSSFGLNILTITRRLAFGNDDAGWSSINPAIYCDTSSGTPFGGDDSGFIPPPKSAIANCEIKVGGGVSKLALCYLNCAALRASGTLTDEAAEEACESTCTSTFTGLVAGLTGCPSCIDSGAIANMTESLLDGTYVPAIYCASPSGAFVQ